MKKLSIYIMALAGALTLASCADDFLEQSNTSSLNKDGFYESDEAISQATATLYNYVWNSFNGKLYYSMGDGRSNNITAQWSDYIKVYTNFNETSLSEGLQEGWASLYSVVAQANNVINDIRDKSTSAVSESAKAAGIGEARFMRGVAYWYLASLWGNVIIFESTADMIDNYVVPTTPQTDVMEYAIRDLEYAAANLPETSSAAGRVNKYTALGMLSRLYLSMAGLTTDGQYDQKNVNTNFNSGHLNPYYLNLAKKAAKKVIEEGPYELMDDYADLFKIENNNCKEDMFQLQWLKGSTDAIGWGCNQDISAFFSWSTMVGETNWGGATCCSWDLYQEFLTDGSERREASIAAYGYYWPDMNVKGGGYTYGVTENPSTNGANIKKYVVGIYADNGVSYKQSTGINTHMMRYAEVLLNYAEAVLGETENASGVGATVTDAEAVGYLNQVRTRVGNQPLSSYNYSSLRHERRLEFAFEGLYWYDLVRRAYTQRQWVINYLNNQDRNRTYKYSTDTSAYEPSANPGQGVAEATEASLLLPYPDADQNKNANLKNNVAPVAWEFGEREVESSAIF